MKYILAAIHKFSRCERGSVLILVSVALLTMIIAIGVAVDMARLQTARAKFSTCVDNAGIAALAKVNQAPAGMNAQDWVTEVANQYYIANCRTGYGNTSTVSLTSENVQLSADQNTVTINASTLQNTKFMFIAGVRNVVLTAHSIVTRADQNGLELALVLDNTGSMAETPTSQKAVGGPGSCNGSGYSYGTASDSKICALQVAATSLINIIFGTTNNTAPPNAWVGIIPFAQSVNIGTSNSGWVTTASLHQDFGPTSGTNPQCKDFQSDSPTVVNNNCDYSKPADIDCSNTCTYTNAAANFPGSSGYWGGCVEARMGNDTTDVPPSTQLFPAYWSPYTTTDGYPMSAIGISQQSSYSQYPQIQQNPQFSYVLANDWKDTTSGSTVYETPLQAVTSTQPPYPQGPNTYCTSPLTSMTNDKPTLINALNNMFPNGQTIIPVGMSWGWYMLSPNWQGVWGGLMATNNLPKPYSKQGNIKALVFMTDGYDYFFPGSYTSYKTLLDGELVSANPASTNEARAETELDNRTLALCTAMKKNNIQIFTVGFGQTDNVNVMAASGPPDVNGQLLQSCATDTSHYFFATSAATLNTDFEQIAALLSNLRIQQ